MTVHQMSCTITLPETKNPFGVVDGEMLDIETDAACRLRLRSAAESSPAS